ncbi:MAG: thiamine pyrophosphate-binding protein [Betaproteobacteria bacterium]|nr:thiamine pyrophosphate-binding protein [Betaproteobacteria bacterium]
MSENTRSGSVSASQGLASDAVVDALVEEGVKFVFGMTGDTILPIIDAIYRRRDKIRYITTRVEMSAVAMADGYSRVTGGLGVATMHVGPAVANAVLGTWTAGKDNVPVMVLSANLDRYRLGRDLWHEFDVVGVFKKFTKFSEQMMEAKDARRLMRTAMQAALSGLPGAVHIDFPKDLLAQPADIESSDLSLKGGSRMGYVTRSMRPEAAAVEQAVALLAGAKNPVVIVGRGVTWSKAHAELVRFADALSIPVVAVEMGRGNMPEDHELACGLLGHFGQTTANTMLNEADVVLGLSCQFRNVNTINWQLVPSGATIIQVEADPVDLGRQYAVQLGIQADCKSFLEDALAIVASKKLSRAAADRARAVSTIAAYKKKERGIYFNADLESKPIKPQLIVKVLEKVAKKDAIYVVGAGHNTHFSNFLPIYRPDSYHCASGTGSMAWAFAAALGMKLAHPERQVIVPIGDGDFSMNAQEIETAVRENIPVTVVIYNDKSFGALRIFQKGYYGDRQLGSEYGETDFVKLAEAYGAVGFRVDDPKDLEPVVVKALASNKVTIIDVRIDPWELAHRSPEFKEFHRF